MLEGGKSAREPLVTLLRQSRRAASHAAADAGSDRCPCTPRGPPCRCYRRGYQCSPTERRRHQLRQRRASRRARHPLERGARFLVSPLRTTLNLAAGRSAPARSAAGDEQRTLVGQPVRSHPAMSWSGVDHRDCSLDVEVALATVVDRWKSRRRAAGSRQSQPPHRWRELFPPAQKWRRPETRFATRHVSAIEPSSTASRSCCCVSLRSRPTATLAPGAALRTYQASVLPLGSPIEWAYASLGWT